MIPAGVPANEEERLFALERAEILDTPPEQAFDDLTRLAAAICGTPIALVSLLDRDRQWFKSRVGLSVSETPRHVSFCAHAILEDVPFVVTDAASDARFADNPLVKGEPRIRLYAGAQIVTSDRRKLGTLCVIDSVARTLSADQIAALGALARQVAAQIDLRTSAANLRRSNAALAFAAREARAAKDQLDDLLDSASDLIQAVSLDGRFLYVNRAWRETLGFSPEEVLTMHFQHVVAPEALTQVLALWESIKRGEDVGVFEATLLHKDRQQRVFVEGTATRRLVDDKMVAVRSIVRDVTSRRNHEERFLRYADVVEAMQIGLVVWEPERSPSGPANFRMLALNRAAREVLGLSAEQIGAWFHELFPEVAKGRTLDLYRQALEGADLVIARDVAYGGRTFNTSVFRLPGPLVGVAFDDVTGRKAVDRMKDEFVSTVSHELRTPLTSIRGALGLIEAGVLGAIPADALEVVRIARTNTDRLVRLINDILDLEKIEAGKLELKTSVVEPAALVATTVRGLRSVAEEARVTLRTEVAELEPIEGDDDRLVQVLTNLVSNAIKFSEPGEDVWIRAQGAAGSRVRFTVEDRGEGIAEEDLPKLFGKFQQLDAADNRRRGGTGLGLSISKAIVEQHGGDIGVSSARGRGSVFWFELPNVERPSLPSITSGVSSVLVVDDDLERAMKIGSLLVQEGYTVERASSLRDARALFTTRVPRAAVVACKLPDCDGRMLLDALRALPALSRLPVLFVGGDEPPAGAFHDRFVIGYEGQRLDRQRFTATLRWALRPRAQLRALLVEDDTSARKVLVRQLMALGFECIQASSGTDGVRLARASAPDLLVLDVRLPGIDGYGVVETLRAEASHDTPLLVYSALDLTPTERRALTLGPTRFVTKSRSSEVELLGAVRDLLPALPPPRSAPMSR